MTPRVIDVVGVATVFGVATEIADPLVADGTIDPSVMI
jgi:hypothetical protein